MGKYLHKFNAEEDFNEAYNGEEYIEPWVSYTDVPEMEDEEHVNYNKVQGIASIPVYHDMDYADLDIPVNGEDGLSFSYTGAELRQWLDNYCEFRIAEEFVSSIEISASGWDGDYKYELQDGFYYVTTIESGWESTRVTVHLNPSSNLEDAKVFDLSHDAH